MKEKKNPKRIVLIAAAVLVVVLFLNIWRVFRFTSDLTRDAGRYHLESVSGDFESTIDDAQRLAMSLGIQAHPYLGDPKKIKDFVYSKKAEILKDVDGCFNVYMAGTGWAIIPDFDMPDDYVATKRDWYRGAKRDRTYVSAPYVDAMTKDICFTVSVLLGDSDTVLAIPLSGRHLGDGHSRGGAHHRRCRHLRRNDFPQELSRRAAPGGGARGDREGHGHPVRPDLRPHNAGHD